VAEFRVRRIRDVDRAFIAHFIGQHRLPASIVSRGRLHDAPTLPGFVAFRGSEATGLLVYTLEQGDCEIVLLHMAVDRIGLGSSLLREAKKTARKAGCSRVWVVTGNDDTRALRFYQRNGFRLVALHRDARDQAREVSPQIPRIGRDGIPVHDELELELDLLGQRPDNGL